MHGYNCAEKDWNERKGDDTAVDACDKSESAEGLCDDYEVSQRAGQAKAREKLRGASGSEDKKFQAGVRKKKDAECDAK